MSLCVCAYIQTHYTHTHTCIHIFMDYPHALICSYNEINKLSKTQYIVGQCVHLYLKYARCQDEKVKKKEIHIVFEVEA